MYVYIQCVQLICVIVLFKLSHRRERYVHCSDVQMKEFHIRRHIGIFVSICSTTDALPVSRKTSHSTNEHVQLTKTQNPRTINHLTLDACDDLKESKTIPIKSYLSEDTSSRPPEHLSVTCIDRVKHFRRFCCF